MKSLFVSAALFVGSIVLATPAEASVQVGDLLKFGNGVGSPGGIFQIDDLNDPGSPNFATFCVEITEFVNFTSTYGVEGIGTQTVQGGKTLSSYTAWLYNSFLDASLNGFNGSAVGDVNTLQLAIWLGMGYTASDVMTNISNSWYNTYSSQLATKTWAADFAADAGWSGIGDVRVINLRKVNSNGDYTTHAQDQLIRLDVIPEPLSLAVWSLLAVCVGSVAIRHRP